VKEKEERANVPRIAGWTIDTILRTWQQELDEHVNTFMQQASQIKHWDNKLFQNSSQVIQLQKEVAKVFEAQKSMDITLGKIKAQQQTMANTLSDLENSLSATINEMEGNNQMLTRDIGLEHRSDLYKMAEQIDQNLNNLQEKLQRKIEQLNETNATSVDPSHPLNAIVGILNNHMQSLQWIEKKSQEVSENIDRLTYDMKNVQP